MTPAPGTLSYDVEADAAYVHLQPVIALGDVVETVHLEVLLGASDGGGRRLPLLLELDRGGRLLGLELLCASAFLPRAALVPGPELPDWSDPVHRPDRPEHIERGIPMAIRDLAGTGALQDALATTNELLTAVLEELRETNSTRLQDVSAELREVSAKLDQLVAAQS